MEHNMWFPTSMIILLDFKSYPRKRNVTYAIEIGMIGLNFNVLHASLECVNPAVSNTWMASKGHLIHVESNFFFNWVSAYVYDCCIYGLIKCVLFLFNFLCIWLFMHIYKTSIILANLLVLPPSRFRSPDWVGHMF